MFYAVHKYARPFRKLLTDIDNLFICFILYLHFSDILVYLIQTYKATVNSRIPLDPKAADYDSSQITNL